METMRTILIPILSLSFLLQSTPGGSSNDTIPYYMFFAAGAFKVDIDLLYAFCRVESKCRETALNKNDANKKNKALGIIEHSYGLFQLKLATARSLGFIGIKKKI